MSKIRVAEFKQRLETLCLRKGGRGLPRRWRDQHILFKSVILMLDTHESYAEDELNMALERWLAEVGQAIEIDHVTLRRHLVDEGYIERDPAGQSYHVSLETVAGRFDTAIDEIVPITVLEEAIIRREQQKQQHLKRRANLKQYNL